jgi:hypothetical protein
LKAPLIAVISVGIAAAAPAVAVSAVEENEKEKAGHPQADGRVAEGSGVEPVSVKTNLHQPPGAVTLEKPTKEQNRQRRLVRRYLVLRNRANRLIARRDHRKPKIVHTVAQARWSSRGVVRSIRVLRKRVRRVRAQLRRQAAGLTPAVRATLKRIAACESKGNPRAIGGGGSFRGKYQFSYGTWQAVGGSGDPASASEAEQDRRAAMLMKRSGTSPWPVCG